MKCKKCKSNFHHCSSCGCDGYSEYGFCSYKCKKDFFNENLKQNFEKFLNSLNDDQLLFIDEFLGDYGDYEHLYDGAFVTFISRKK